MNVAFSFFTGIRLKVVTMALIAFALHNAYAQLPAAVDSDVYRWMEGKRKSQVGRRMPIFEGSSRDFQLLEAYSVAQAARSQHSNQTHNDVEELIIIKEGQLITTIDSVEKIVGPGSILLVMPGKEHTLLNGDEKAVSYYVLRYASRELMDPSRGSQAGGSIAIDWNDLEFKEHSRGGVRNFFNRPTAMCSYFEMHTTTLREGLSSHEPHSHRAAEIILVMEGNTEMLIGEKTFGATAGDLYFIESEVLHGIKNVGKGPCTYFAFQFR